MRRGAATILVVAIVAVLGGIGYFFGPKWLHGDSRRAQASSAATERVEAATNAQGSAAAAGVVKIGEANAVAEASPSKEFISREVPAVLSKLPAPDPAALLEAEKRRAAVMEGRLAEAARLYQDEAKKSAQLQKERDDALAERRRVDTQLAEVAAARLAAERQRMALIIVVVILAAGWLYTKIYSISPSDVGRALADVKSGKGAVEAFTEALAPRLHARVRQARKMATEPSD